MWINPTYRFWKPLQFFSKALTAKNERLSNRRLRSKDFYEGICCKGARTTGHRRIIDVLIRSFGAAAPITQTLKVKSLELRKTFPNAGPTTISGLVTEHITVTQQYQETEYAALLRRSGKWLADDRTIAEDWRDLEVDVLIGVDYLWQVCNSTIETRKCGLQAMSSIFG